MTASGTTILNDHQVEIVDGKITLRFAGTATTDLPRVFDDEEKAMDCLVEAIRNSRNFIVIGTVSCGYPQQFGRPDFSYEKFIKTVVARLRADGTAPVRQ